MTYKAIRAYAQAQAARFATLVEGGRHLDATDVEAAVIERCGETLGGTYFPGAEASSPSVVKRREYLAKVFVLACRARGLSTRVVHLTKHGEV